MVVFEIAEMQNLEGVVDLVVIVGSESVVDAAVIIAVVGMS